MKNLRFLFLLLFSVTVFSQGTIPQGNATSVIKNPGYQEITKGLRIPANNDETATPNIPSSGKIRFNPSTGVFQVNNGALWLNMATTDIFNQKTGWKSPQDYGYVEGRDRTLNTASVQQCFTENDRVFLYGRYEINAQIVPKSGQFVFSNNATIRNYDSNENTFAFPALSNFSFDGKLTIEGNGKASGTSIGMFLVGCQGFSIKGVTVKNMSGQGVYLSGGGLNRGDRGAFIDLSLQSNWVGVQTDSGDEYHTFTNINAGGNALAAYIASGNIIFNGGSISDNDAGIYLGAGYNHAHGILANLNINHNTAYNLKVENVDNGHTITGCHFYGTTTENIIIINSKGLNFNGGIIDGLISNNDTNTPRGAHIFDGCFFRNFTTFTDNDINTTNVVFKNCYHMVTGEPSTLNNKTSKVINDLQSADIIGSGFYHTTVATPTNNAYGGTFPGGIYGSAARDKNTSFAWTLNTNIQGDWWVNRKFADVWQTPKKIAFDTDLALKANIASPTLTGDPKAPTPPFGDNDTSIATTAHVQAAISGLSFNTTDVTQSITASMTVTSSSWSGSPNNGHLTIFANASSGSITVNLSSVFVHAGRTVNVIKTDSSANAVIINGGAVNINGSTTFNLTGQYQNAQIKTNGTQFYISN